MHFEGTLTLSSLLVAGTIVASVVGALWAARGWVDGFKSDLLAASAHTLEEIKIRHRQNTNRLDFMLELVNQQRVEDGKPRVPCPYRVVIDQ